MDKIIEFIKKPLTILVICGIIISGLFFAYDKINNHVPINNIPSYATQADLFKLDNKFNLNPGTIEKGLKDIDIKPDVVWQSDTQKQSDKEAEKIAKSDKANYILKQTLTDVNTGKITNKYLGIHAEKTHKIKAGLSVVDSKIYADVGYQDKKNEAILHLKPGAPPTVAGVTYMRTIKEW